MADNLNPSDVMDHIWLAAKQAHQSNSWYEACKLRLSAQHEMNKLLSSRDAELARLRDEVERLRAARKGFVVVYPCDYARAGIGPVHDTRESAQQEIDEFDGRDKCYLFIEEVEF